MQPSDAASTKPLLVCNHSGFPVGCLSVDWRSVSSLHRWRFSSFQTDIASILPTSPLPVRLRFRLSHRQLQPHGDLIRRWRVIWGRDERRRCLETQSKQPETCRSRTIAGFGFHDVVIESPLQSIQLSDLDPVGIGDVLIAYRKRLAGFEAEGGSGFIWCMLDGRVSVGSALDPFTSNGPHPPVTIISFTALS
ncbi:unnamed protein product [Microthlaspi erraticum]|uniref:Uncharacterized protein n=1 Tax=Microthlaspi erraticum TaxID=1685480 RepID=A0A6D2JG44_9BRAS|nr:unnamed protein product [Microthlaspi erraticum]